MHKIKAYVYFKDLLMFWRKYLLCCCFKFSLFALVAKNDFAHVITVCVCNCFMMLEYIKVLLFTFHYQPHSHNVVLQNIPFMFYKFLFQIHFIWCSYNFTQLHHYNHIIYRFNLSIWQDSQQITAHITCISSTSNVKTT